MALNTTPGSAGAEAYCSVSDADAHHSARGNTLWATLTTTEKEQALRRATDHMGVYAERWKGERSYSTQALDWPRAGVIAHQYEVDYLTVPAMVAKACAELAFRAAKGELAPDLTAQKQSVKVGPIETTYAVGTRQTPKYQAVDNMLAPYLTGGAGQVRVVRS